MEISTISDDSQEQREMFGVVVESLREDRVQLNRARANIIISDTTPGIFQHCFAND